MNFDKDGYHKCDICDGKKVIPLRHPNHILGEVCPQCKGMGGCDWVEHAMGKYGGVNTNLYNDVAYQNINVLMQMIREEGLKINQDIRVTIERNNPHNHAYPYEMLSPYNLK